MTPLTHDERMRTMNQRLSFLVSATVLTATGFLAACGGGGGGGGEPPPTVTRMNINPLSADLRNLMVTLEGTNLAAGLSVTSAQCTTLTRSTTAPHVSDASTAYYQCATSVTAPNAVTVAAARSSDGGTLATASFSIGATPTVTQALAGEGAVAATDTLPEVPGRATYSKQMTVTVTGSNVNQGLDVSSSSCTGMTLSTTPPLVSTASTAYYRCKAAAVSPLTQVVITPAGDAATVIASPLFTVPQPQVTMTIRRGTGSSSSAVGTFVITLRATEAPLTVDNFLSYVNAGFYNGNIFDLIGKDLADTPRLLGGGAYQPTAGVPPPPPKPAGAPITLESTTGLTNVQWSVAMDRLANNVNSATTGFFINLIDNPDLDIAPAYAVFGTVTLGTGVLTTMASATCDVVTQFSTCLPIPNLVIESAVQTQ